MTPDANQISSLVYEGIELLTLQPKHTKDISIFTYIPGDTLLFTGYADTAESSIQDAPVGNETYTFQFGSLTSCPGLPTVTYGGQTYNTVQIGNQCWMAENLTIGTMINGDTNQTNNSTL